MAVDLETTVALASVVTTTVLAIVALVFTYRQNVGWKPILVIHNPVLGGRAGGDGFDIGITVEFWNRRKYPVVVQFIEARLAGATAKDLIGYARQEPHVSTNRFRQSTDTVVSSQDRAVLPVRLEIERESLDAMRPIFTVEVSYLDPYLGRFTHRRSTYRFFYPELGWKQTKRQRAEARQRFQQMLAKG